MTTAMIALRVIASIFFVGAAVVSFRDDNWGGVVLSGLLGVGALGTLIPA